MQPTKPIWLFLGGPAEQRQIKQVSAPSITEGENLSPVVKLYLSKNFNFLFDKIWRYG
jgi:hypothetical protein